jgi:hypothetical protein
MTFKAIYTGFVVWAGFALYTDAAQILMTLPISP